MTHFFRCECGVSARGLDDKETADAAKEVHWAQHFRDHERRQKILYPDDPDLREPAPTVRAVVGDDDLPWHWRPEWDE